MAKNKIPKKIAGYKGAKAIRKSSVIRALFESDIGRDVLANALTAAAAVLVAEREEISDTTMKGARKGARAFGIAGEAIRKRSQAATEVVTDAAHSCQKKCARRPTRPLVGAPPSTEVGAGPRISTKEQANGALHGKALRYLYRRPGHSCGGRSADEASATIKTA
jgi:hypothetical protein